MSLSGFETSDKLRRTFVLACGSSEERDSSLVGGILMTDTLVHLAPFCWVCAYLYRSRQHRGGQSSGSESRFPSGKQTTPHLTPYIGLLLNMNGGTRIIIPHFFDFGRLTMPYF